MAAFDFPNTPTIGQTVTNGGVVYQWDGVKWVAAAGAGITLPLSIALGGTGATSAAAARANLGITDGGGGGVADAPTDGQAYLRQGSTTSWIPGLPLTGGTISGNLAVTGNLALTGTPTAPTAAAGTNTTQLATTAFVASAVATGGGNFLPLTGGTLTGTIATGNGPGLSVSQYVGHPSWLFNSPTWKAEMALWAGTDDFAINMYSVPGNVLGAGLDFHGTGGTTIGGTGGRLDLHADLNIDGGSLSSSFATNPPNPQNVGIGLKPLALWNRTTGQLESTGNKSTGVMGSWTADDLLIISTGTGNAPYFILGRANGTAAVPTMPVAADNLGVIVGTGYVGDNWTSMPWAVRVRFEANENWSTTAQGTRITFHTTPNGTVAAQEAAVIEHNGNFTITGATATKPGSTAWVNPSDPRLKSQMEPYEVGLAQCLRLNPIRYRYNGQGPLQGYRGEHVGLDADHVAEVMPSLHGSMEYEGESYGTVDSGELVYTLLNAVKELAAEMAELKKRSW